MASITSGLLNPLTPLAWLPVDVADQFEASRYVYFATLAAFATDWLIAMPSEYHILIKHGFRPTLIIYLISRCAVCVLTFLWLTYARIFAMAFVLTNTVYQSAPVPNCRALQLAVAVSYAIAVPATSALFLLRVIAVFQRSRTVVIVFGLLWLVILGTSINIPFATSGMHIGTTRYCINTELKSFSSISYIATTVNDTMVFLAISWRLTTFSTAHGRFWQQLRSFMSGAGLPKFSRELLQGGQTYYAATVVLNIVTMSLILSPTVPAVLRAMFTIPNIALGNAMATRVFRAAHLGFVQAQSSEPSHPPNHPHQTQRMRSVVPLPDGVYPLMPLTQAPLDCHRQSETNQPEIMFNNATSQANGKGTHDSLDEELVWYGQV